MDIFFTESELNKVDAFLDDDEILIDNNFDFSNFDKKCIKKIGMTLPTIIANNKYGDDMTYHAKVIDKEKFFLVVMKHEFNFRYKP